MSRKLIGATLTAGDATAQLMWRLQNGEAPANLAALRAAFVLIGSNDLTYASFRVSKPLCAEHLNSGAACDMQSSF